MSEKLLYWHEAKEKLTQIVAQEALKCMVTPGNCDSDFREGQENGCQVVMNSHISFYNDGIKDLAITLINLMEADTDEQQ